MDQELASDLELTPPIPEEDLVVVLSTWSGKGLWDAMAACEDETVEHRWSADDIRARAVLVLLQQFADKIERWPASSHTWLEALPAESVQRRETTTAPSGSTSWVETRLSGWPPREFTGRTRHREADTLLVTTLRWTLEQLSVAEALVKRRVSTRSNWMPKKLAPALRLLEHEPVASAEPIEPSPADVNAFGSEGRPWSQLAPLTKAIRELLKGRDRELALHLLLPIEELRWRLFHLAVLGRVVRSLNSAGAKLVSLYPLSHQSRGPVYEAILPDGKTAHLWFEGGAAWRYYGKVSPYVAATAGLRKRARPLGPDLLLIVPMERALIVECKYSYDATTIGRGGYEQSLSYMAEMHGMLAQEVNAAVICPSGAADGFHQCTTSVGRIGIGDIDTLSVLIEGFVQGHTS